MEFKWTKRTTLFQKQLSNLEAEITQLFLENHTFLFYCIFSRYYSWYISKNDSRAKSFVCSTKMLENLKLKKNKWRYFSKTNYGMTVNKLLTISGYRECSQYIRKESIWNTMPRTKYKSILQNCHFFNNEEADKGDKSYKLEPLITYLNENFFHRVSNDAIKSIND